MSSNTKVFQLKDKNAFIKKMPGFANKSGIFCFLHNNGYQFQQPSFDCKLAIGARRSLQLSPGNAFNQLRSFYNEKPSWLFGHLSYELKNEVEKLHTKAPSLIDFGLAFFFEPEIILTVSANELHIEGDVDAEKIFAEILQDEHIPVAHKPIAFHAAFNKGSYMDVVEKIQQHIKLGDCYEINFCQQFSADHCHIDPIEIFSQLNSVSPNPFAALYKFNDKYCICASPERYLQKKGNQLISQPMKGTSKRFTHDRQADLASRQALAGSQKERSENVMIVDLVRNDLSRVCSRASVYVKELFGIYAFPQVFQMISTIAGTVDESTHWVDCLEKTFPMGSMTGAPKKRVMELIDEYEHRGRGLFSGSIGYVTPTGDFDFNVVIRSIFYDAFNKKLAYLAGSGITIYSSAEREYEECLMKAAAIKEVLMQK